jgi:hypothetical protein
VRYAGMHIQHMQKALNQMNLHHVVSDMTGVTGMRIIRAILAGERDPQVLAQHRDRLAASAKRPSPKPCRAADAKSICSPYAKP